MVNFEVRPDGSKRVHISFDSNVKVLRRKGRDRKAFVEDYPERSRTKPEFHKAVNLKKIMAKYEKTGVIDPLLYRDMHYGDFVTGEDFAQMMMRVNDANEQFLNLPHQIRNRFNNDPAQMLNFLADPKNDSEAIEIGLKKAPKTTQTVEGSDYVVRDDKGVEIRRYPVKPAPAPGAAPGTPAPAAAAAGSPA